jgi:hypothetical protein
VILARKSAGVATGAINQTLARHDAMMIPGLALLLRRTTTVLASTSCSPRFCGDHAASRKPIHMVNTFAHFAKNLPKA